MNDDDAIEVEAEPVADSPGTELVMPGPADVATIPERVTGFLTGANRAAAVTLDGIPTVAFTLDSMTIGFGKEVFPLGGGIKGIVVGSTDKRALWVTKFDPKDPQPPICSSADGVHGQPWRRKGLPVVNFQRGEGLGDVWKADDARMTIDGEAAVLPCARCPYGQFGSDVWLAKRGRSERAKACPGRVTLLISVISGDNVATDRFARVDFPPTRTGLFEAWESHRLFTDGHVPGSPIWIKHDQITNVDPETIEGDWPEAPESLIEEVIEWVPGAGDATEEDAVFGALDK